MSLKIVKRTLVALVVANVLVAAAWWSRDELVRAGIWPAPPVQRVDLGKWSLPAIANVEQESTAAAADLRSEEAADETPPSDVPPPALPEIAEVELESTTAATDAGSETAGETSPSNMQAQQDDAPSSPPAAEQTPASAAPPPLPPTPTCVVAGPFKDKPAAEALAARFEAAGGSANIDAEAVATAPAYLVYVAPTTRESAANAWQELNAQGIDAYVIPAGTRENGVSVGVFSVRERALAQRDRVAQLGFSVLMQPLLRTAAAYRVVGRDVPAEALADVTVAPCDSADAQ